MSSKVRRVAPGVGVIFPELLGESGFEEAHGALDLIAALPVRVVDVGRHADLVRRGGLYARLAELQFNLPAAAGLYGELAGVLPALPGEKPDDPAQVFLARLRDLIARSGAPRRLREVGVSADALPMLAHDAMKQTRLLDNNPVPVTEADALALYRAAF